MPDTVRAIIAHAFGPPESLACETVELPPPSAGQVRVRIHAAGVSFVDVLTAGGGYQVKPPLPFIPGSECAGVIEALGPDVVGLAVGQRVQASGWGGMYADAANLPTASVRPIPDAMSFAAAAVFGVSYATAWHALVDRARLQAGETLLVLGAGGATGYAAVQVGKHLGARVIASASSDGKRALAVGGGADVALDSSASDWRDAVKAATGGRGADVVFDPIGGDTTELAFRTLGWGGRHLVIGFPGGMTALRTNLALIKGACLVGVDIRQFGIFEPVKAAANLATLFDLAGQGVLNPAIAQTYPLPDFVPAMTAAASGALAGRVVLTMAD